MTEYITTHEELIKLHGAKVTCKIKNEQIDDAKISVDGEFVYVCQNIKDGCVAPDKLGYKYSWEISNDVSKYETISSGCFDIKLVEFASDKVIEKLDERLDNLTPSVILEATKTWDNFTKVWNELYHKAEKIKSVSTLEKFTRKVKELTE